MIRYAVDLRIIPTIRSIILLFSWNFEACFWLLQFHLILLWFKLTDTLHLNDQKRWNGWQEFKWLHYMWPGYFKLSLIFKMFFHSNDSWIFFYFYVQAILRDRMPEHQRFSGTTSKCIQNLFLKYKVETVVIDKIISSNQNNQLCHR